MWIVNLIDLLDFSEQIERAKEQNKTKFDVDEFKKFCDEHNRKIEKLRRNNNAHSESR